MPWSCYLLGRFARTQLPRQIPLNPWVLNAFFYPKMCDGNAENCGKCRRLRRPNAELFTAFPDSVTLAARPGICLLFTDGWAFGWPHCGLSSECLTGAVWEGRFGTEAAQARVGEGSERQGCGFRSLQCPWTVTLGCPASKGRTVT